jgi:hypothetical protein
MSASGIDNLYVSQSGAVQYGSDAYSDITGATGAGGLYASSGFTGVTIFNAAAEAGVTALPTGNPTDSGVYFTPVVIIGGTGSPVGDIRGLGEGTGYSGIGSTGYGTGETNFTGLAAGTNYSGTFYAVYEKAGAKHTGKAGVGTTAPSAYYENTFRTQEFFEFDDSYTIDTGDFSLTTSGSGVYTDRNAIEINFDITNREGNALTNTSQLQADSFFEGIDISILDSAGNVVANNYEPDYQHSSFTFSPTENQTVFGEGKYIKDFGLQTAVKDQNSLTQTSKIQLRGNYASIKNIVVSASGGIFVDETTGNYQAPDTGAESALPFTNRQLVNSAGTTGEIVHTITFEQDSAFTAFDYTTVWWGLSGEFQPTPANSLGNFPTNRRVSTIRLTTENGLPEKSGLYFKFRPFSKVMGGPIFGNGAYTIEPYLIPIDPALTNQGTQSIISGSLSIGGSGSGVGNLSCRECDLGDNLGGGVLKVKDLAGTEKVLLKTDSDNDEGTLSIKNAAGVVATDVRANKSVLSATNSNIYSTGSVIVGGSDHTITGDFDVIAGGVKNNISGCNFAFIGGGSGLDVNNSTYSSSIGGYNNDIDLADYSIIGGGFNNNITGNPGGFLGGGYNNVISGTAGAIAGGVLNKITGGGWSFIGGGEGNVITSTLGSILGGEGNEVDGDSASIAGGDGNHASGQYSFIGGGFSNKASGDYSYAFGRKALVAATHSGAAVLADGQDRTHASSGEHTLLLDFANGVYVEGGPLYVSGAPVLTGENNPAEADTLQTVTARGATTNQAISITNTSSSALAIATDALVVDGSNDRVGIGTATSMQSKLDVFGNIAVGAGGYYAGSSPAPTDGMIIKGTVGIGTTSPASASNLHVYGSGIIGRSFSSAPVDGLAVYGKVGIGTNSVGSKLDVNGNVTIGASLMGYGAPTDGLAVWGNAGIGTYNSTNKFGVYGNANIGSSYQSSAAPTNGLIVEGNLGVGTSSPTTALDVRGTISGYTGLFNDKVGIGTNSPQAELDVAADTDVSGKIGRAQIGYAGDSDVASFAHVDFANATDFALAQTSAGHTVINARDGYNIYFREGDANMAAFDGSTKDFYVDTNTLYVDASEDRVGINESSPSYTLDVTASDASSLLSRFYNSSSTNGQGLLIRAGETANANRILQCASRNDTKIMTVNSNGSVGVGTDSPAGRFDIVSSRNAENDLSDADNYHLHLHNNSDDTDESIGIGFGITSDTDALGACIGHERKGALSFGDLFFATKPDGGSVTERLRIASNGNVGIGTNAPANALDVVGHFSATSKSFVIDHPTKENKKLQYGSLEGPEHGVFIRGTTNKNVIKLPDYWKDLVHEDSITVTLTPVHAFQSLYVKSKTPEQIMVGGVKKSYDYVVYGERKDVAKLEIEI